MAFDLVLARGRIYPMTQEGLVHSVMGIRRGKVAYVGDELPDLVSPVADLGGKTVLPGFIDTHVHFSGLGVITTGLDLRGVRSFREIEERLNEFLGSDRFEGGVVAGFGVMNEIMEEGRLPKCFELDQMCPKYPLVLAKGDGHSSTANSAGLKFLRIDSSVPGAETDPTTGEMTGICRKDANFRVYASFSRLFGPSRLLKGMVNANNLALNRGVTGVHAAEGLGFPGDSDLKGVLMVAPHLDVEVTTYFQSRDVERARKYGLPRIGACFSTAVDGSPSSGTAAFFEPFGPSGGTGTVYFTQEELDRFVLEAHRAGLQVNLHAIGDRAIEMALSAMEKAIEAHPRANHRHRIEHCTFPTRDQVRRIARAGIAVSTQPAFFGMEGLDIESAVRTFGPERAARCTPLREMLDAGIVVSGGSDAPVTHIDALAGVQAAVLHPVPEQRLSVYQAISLFTRNAAMIGFTDDRKGTLEAGKDADFVVFGDDPFEVQPSGIGAISIEATYIRGRRRPPRVMGIPGLVWSMVRRGFGMAN